MTTYNVEWSCVETVWPNRDPAIQPKEWKSDPADTTTGGLMKIRANSDEIALNVAKEIVRYRHKVRYLRTWIAI